DTPQNFIIPADILKAFRANKDAWNNFLKMPFSYRRVRIAYIESQKRHGMDMYKKALAHFIKKTEQNKRIGFVRERRDAAA
ncbi:MAG: YdeI/OmpD-associated family protein, partial [Candidatus Paceibacterota bacterium]